jgi:hypothetical protein
MDVIGRLERIARFEGAYAPVEALVAGMGREALAFVPPIDGAWSINDFLVHFLDADLSMAFRARSAIAEAGRGVPVWDEDAWKDRLRYDGQDGLACLALAKGIRSFVSSTLRSFAGDDWAEFTIMHPARGKLDLEGLLDLYDEHVVFHLPLIRRDIEAWKSR